ncbi:hypothetical protein RINTHM_5240 [Richelia intracellularis HM01]|uniref:Uncharacterized protein n=1 Tax=Richelia intracellularis HH01 TaxID=1165094 RepID=M1WRE7_9NOST|nr:hypothetical protein RINTHM_5240 [Richelia intracellularis HM01]CCH66894.1 hypothetical protein RINTHH_7390 [Richelia intracellularis HH01]
MTVFKLSISKLISAFSSWAAVDEKLKETEPSNKFNVK